MCPKLSDRNLKAVRPYGDTYDDGVVQLSFTLPLPAGEVASEAAKRLTLKMGFEECEVVYDKDLGEDYTYFIVYAKTRASVDFTAIEVPKVDVAVFDRETIDKIIEQKYGRKLVIVGACTGDDAHTVGIDAIMNMKGYAGHYGLERYKMIDAVNLGSQVKNEELIKLALEKNADAVLVSQVVTQKDTHLHNLTEFVELAEAYRLRERALLIVGGPRISHQLAKELGFDAGFGRGAFAEHVASFIVEKLAEKLSLSNRA
jgi:beta-lysine 5,6-aminomutase beta subunit